VYNVESTRRSGSPPLAHSCCSSRHSYPPLRCKFRFLDRTRPETLSDKGRAVLIASSSHERGDAAADGAAAAAAAKRGTAGAPAVHR